MKIFVTGATGFIGKKLVEKLLVEGNQITISLHTNEEISFGERVEFYRFKNDDIGKDIEYFRQSNFNGCIHLASLYLTSHKPEELTRLIDSNIKFGSHILECATQAKIKWFINTGTFWQHYNNSVYSPVNLYAATKQAFEAITEYYIQSNQISLKTLKLCDSYGPNDTRKKIFHIWEKTAREGGILDMSFGEQLIDISHVDDIVSAFWKLSQLLDKKDKRILNNNFYAVRAIKRYTLKELASIFEQASGLRLNINWGKLPYREREVMIPWENGVPIPDWEPKINLVDGIKQLFRFDNKDCQ